MATAASRGVSLNTMIKQSREYVQEALRQGHMPVPTCVVARSSDDGGVGGGPFGCKHPEHNHIPDLRKILDIMNVNATIFIEEINVEDSDGVSTEAVALYIEEEGWNHLVEVLKIVAGRNDLVRIENERLDQVITERLYPLLPGNSLHEQPCPH